MAKALALELDTAEHSSLFEVFQTLGDAGRAAIATGVDNFVASRVVTAIVDDDLPALTHLIRR